MPVTHIRLKCVPVHVRVHGLDTVAETARKISERASSVVCLGSAFFSVAASASRSLTTSQARWLCSNIQPRRRRRRCRDLVRGRVCGGGGRSACDVVYSVMVMDDTVGSFLVTSKRADMKGEQLKGKRSAKRRKEERRLSGRM